MSIIKVSKKPSIRYQYGVNQHILIDNNGTIFFSKVMNLVPVKWLEKSRIKIEHMDSRRNDKLFWKPKGLILSEKALHGSSTAITDYRETSASLKWKVHTVLACIFLHFASSKLLWTSYKTLAKKPNKSTGHVTLFLLCDSREMTLWVALSQSHSG